MIGPYGIETSFARKVAGVLRSGQYEQITGMTQDGEKRRCAFGVAAAVAFCIYGATPARKLFPDTYGRERWPGLLTGRFANQLVEWNDGGRLSFVEIAARLECIAEEQEYGAPIAQPQRERAFAWTGEEE